MPSRVLLVEPFGGMAGDMFLAALLDLGYETFRIEDLRRLASALVPGECVVESSEVRRGSLRALALEVSTPESAHAPHRHLADLLGLVERSGLSAAGRARAGAVLARIAQAEARVHGIAVEEVHFHEVGAVDTLVDVCGAVLALERLGIERVVATVPYVGGGTVACAHGEMPVPAPGTAELLRGIPVRHGAGGERVTPTGAALLAELVDETVEAAGPSGAPLAAEAVGYGAGRRDPAEGPPNLVRVSRCRAAVAGRAGGTTVWLLECNLDDATGEEIGFLLQELRSGGALEAWSAPIQMKKDRPGTLVSALCRADARAGLEALCFAHSPTLGVRWSPRERTECGRRELSVPFEGGTIRVKLRLRPDGAEPGAADVSPELDDLAALARASGRPLRVLEEAVRSVALGLLRKGRV